MSKSNKNTIPLVFREGNKVGQMRVVCLHDGSIELVFEDTMLGIVSTRKFWLSPSKASELREFLVGNTDGAGIQMAGTERSPTCLRIQVVGGLYDGDVYETGIPPTEVFPEFRDGRITDRYYRLNVEPDGLTYVYKQR